MAARRTPQPHEWERTRVCSRCGETKPWALFSPKRYDADGLVDLVSSQCFACRSEVNKKQRAWIRSQINKPGPGHERVPEPWEYVRTKRCSACGEIKTFSSFSPRSYYPDGQIRHVASRCKKCCTKLRDREKHKEWHRQNRASINARSVIHLRKHRREMRRDRTARGRLLPALPLKLWLLGVQREEGGLTNLAHDAGVHEDSLAKVLKRNQRVAEATAEAALCARGLRLDDVYDDLETAA